MRFTLATWNINSVRLRLPIVLKLLDEAQPDVLCLQEIKCPTAEFPEKEFRRRGYEHIVVNGRPGYHGVATISRLPLEPVGHRAFCGKDDARHTAVRLVNGATSCAIHNFYVPAGGDEPDPVLNEKFAHKLDFLKEVTAWFADPDAGHAGSMILAGDLNIAPEEMDVWSHKQLLKVVSHTPIEVDHLCDMRRSRDWVDAVRQHIPASERLYTWWSYRARDWRLADKGRRLDHVWTTPALNGACRSVAVLKDARDWPKPSDHVPIVAEFDI
jgi:exodeoxyribonuclease-3